MLCVETQAGALVRPEPHSVGTKHLDFGKLLLTMLFVNTIGFSAGVKRCKGSN